MKMKAERAPPCRIVVGGEFLSVIVRYPEKGNHAQPPVPNAQEQQALRRACHWMKVIALA